MRFSDSSSESPVWPGFFVPEFRRRNSLLLGVWSRSFGFFASRFFGFVVVAVRQDTHIKKVPEGLINNQCRYSASAKGYSP